MARTNNVHGRRIAIDCEIGDSKCLLAERFGTVEEALYVQRVLEAELGLPSEPRPHPDIA